MSLASRLADAGFAPDGTPLDTVDLRDEVNEVERVIAEHRAVAAEFQRVKRAYLDATAELMRVMQERDDLLSERGIVHRGSEAT
jgi:hypothetical protein